MGLILVASLGACRTDFPNNPYGNFILFFRLVEFVVTCIKGAWLLHATDRSQPIARVRLVTGSHRRRAKLRTDTLNPMVAMLICVLGFGLSG